MMGFTSLYSRLQAGKCPRCPRFEQPAKHHGLKPYDRMKRMTAKRPFDGFDFEGFWDDHPYSLEKYIGAPPSDELIASVEQELGGYRLPAAYVDLARRHNGGLVKRNCHPMKERTGWAEDHVAITGLFAIGHTSKYSLAGRLGSKFMIEEWGYPPIGVVIAD